MTDLVAAVPPHEPAEDALAFAGKAALGAIPVVGTIAAETLSHALETRQAARQHDFNMLVAYSLTDALERLDASVTVEDVVDSDEFVAAITRAQRAAAETANRTKRRRLAAAVVNGGSWAPFSASEREQFSRLVEDFDDLHVFLLHYFINPKAWLDAHDLSSAYTNIYMGGIEGPLTAALGSQDGSWNSPVKQALGDLDRAGLASVPLTTLMSADGIIQPRTHDKGSRFLAFLEETDSANAEPPAQP